MSDDVRRRREDEVSVSEDALYSTNAVATICRVAPRTVSKWFDSGRLSGHKLPGSSTRRIPQPSLHRFLKDHGMFGLWTDFLARTGRTENADAKCGKDRPFGFRAPAESDVAEATPRDSRE